jgi:hypothetical protein
VRTLNKPTERKLTRALLVEELGALELVSGGNGCLLLVHRGPEEERWISRQAADEIVSAAHRLGFGDDSDGVGRGWFAVAAAIAAGYLPDLLSEAIEGVEAWGILQPSLPLAGAYPDTSGLEVQACCNDSSSE